MTGHDIDASPPVDVLGEFAQAAPICKEHGASLHVVDGEDGWVGGWVGVCSRATRAF